MYFVQIVFINVACRYQPPVMYILRAATFDLHNNRSQDVHIIDLNFFN